MGNGSALVSTYYRLFNHIALLSHCVIDLELSVEQNCDSFCKYTDVPFDDDSYHWNDKKSKHIFYRIGFDFCPVDFRNRLYDCFNEAER